MNPDERRAELKRFLRQRRAALDPREAGIKPAKRRRAPGLRREEVASIADVGITWYTWLEQGRAIQVSRDALDRIAHALRLSRSDTRYLFELAGQPPADEEPAALDPRLQLVVDSITGCPAAVIDPCWNAVVFNRLGDQLFDFDGYDGPYRRNHLWRGYLDPKRRAMYLDWQQAMDFGVDLLRSQYATRIGDPQFETFLRAMLDASPEFAASWQRLGTANVAIELVLRMDSPVFGAIATYTMRFPIPGRAGDLLFILPPADEASRAAFARK